MKSKATLVAIGLAALPMTAQATASAECDYAAQIAGDVFLQKAMDLPLEAQRAHVLDVCDNMGDAVCASLLQLTEKPNPDLSNLTFHQKHYLAVRFDLQFRDICMNRQ
ncbi:MULTISPECIES: hypothetical protein [Halomonas]|nr:MULTISPECIES: hypothetical protein [Halomonas]MDR5890284.1 hypothetical protein [Halomonas salina]WJY05798.1 hypothetical protein QWG60_08690 [Halomonas halophila]